MIREAIEALVSGRSLSFEQAQAVMEEIMTGQAAPSQLGAFLTALRLKGETPEEIAGMAYVMREKALRVTVKQPVTDTCGTGGDGAATFNISTAAAFVAAGAGLTIAKHGNRAMSSQCGSADVLEALGVKIDLSPEGVTQCLEEVGIGFMFAQIFHPAMKYAAPVRREIGIRTVFNVLGPLTNPARAQSQVIGVPNKEVGGKIASVLQRLGTRHSLVVYSLAGMDELCTSGDSLVWDVRPEHVAGPVTISPASFGFKEATPDQIKGGSPQDNAGILRRVMAGEKNPARDVTLLNAAAALVAADKARDLKEGIRLAGEAIDSGQAEAKLESLIEVSQKLK